MAGLIPWGEIDAAGDVTTGALIGRSLSRSQAAVDDRIKALGPELAGYTPDVIAAAQAAVTSVLAGRDLEYWKGAAWVPSDADLDDLTTGIYSVPPQFAPGFGLPGGSVYGSLQVWSFGSRGVQQWVPLAAGAGGQVIYQRSNIGSGWTAWKPISDLTALVVTDQIDGLESGTYSVASAVVSSALGLPGSGIGVLRVWRFGTWGGVMVWHSGTSDEPTVFEARRSTTGWGPWRRASSGSAAGSSLAGFRTAALSLTLGQAAANAPTSGTVRFPLNYAAPITRWRAHVANVNPRTGVGRGPVSLTGIWVGGDAGSGAFADAPVRVGNAGTVPESGEYVTPWVSTQIHGAPNLLSLGYSAADAPYLLVGGCWRGTDPASASATASTGLSRQGTAPLHVWIEAETPSTTPVVAVAGDSLACGVGATLPVHDSPISVWARNHGALPMHYANSGDTMSASLDSSHYKWQTFSQVTAPDSILFEMGSNDVFGSDSLDALKTLHGQYAALLASITPAVYQVTVPTRNGADSARQTIRKSYNTWLQDQPNGIRDLFNFATAVSSNDTTINNDFNADGTHLTTSGYLAQARAIIRPIAPLPATASTSVDVTSVAKAAGALAEGNTGTLTLRRVGNLVTARFTDLLLNPDSTGLVSFGTVPVGYRPAWYSSRYLWLIGLSNGITIPQIVSLASNQLRWQGNLQGSTSRPPLGIQGEVTWETSTPWPTT